MLHSGSSKYEFIPAQGTADLSGLGFGGNTSNGQWLGTMERRSKLLRRKLEPNDILEDPGDRSSISEEQAFLSSVSDEDLSCSGLHLQVQEWLVNARSAHPSCWRSEAFRSKEQLVRTAVLRRLARVELWYLENLLECSSGTKTCGENEAELRHALRTRMDSLYEQMCQACTHQCRDCSMTCGKSRNHRGMHSCGTDHSCHCTLRGGMCQLCAGHDGPHRFPSQQQPQLPQPQLPQPQLPQPQLPQPQLPLPAKLPHFESADKSHTRHAKRYSDDEECPICLESLNGCGVKLRCRHAFHSECVRSWLHVAPRCPMCRRHTGGFGVPELDHALSAVAQPAAASTAQQQLPAVVRPATPAMQAGNSGSTSEETSASGSSAVSMLRSPDRMQRRRPGRSGGSVTSAGQAWALPPPSRRSLSRAMSSAVQGAESQQQPVEGPSHVQRIGSISPAGLTAIGRAP